MKLRFKQRDPSDDQQLQDATKASIALLLDRDEHYIDITVTEQVVVITVANIPTDLIGSVVERLDKITKIQPGEDESAFLTQLKTKNEDYVFVIIEVVESAHAGLEVTLVEFAVVLEGAQLTFTESRRKIIFIKVFLLQDIKAKLTDAGLTTGITADQIVITFEEIESSKLIMDIQIRSLSREYAENIEREFSQTWLLEGGLKGLLEKVDSHIFSDLTISLRKNATTPTMFPTSRRTLAPAAKLESSQHGTYCNLSNLFWIYICMVLSGIN